MATHALPPAIALANTLRAAKNAALGRSMALDAASDPFAKMLTLAALLPRQDVEAAIDAIIDALDTADGDADEELNGTEEDFRFDKGYWGDLGPGCPISDIDCCPAGDDDPLRNGDVRDKDDDAEPWFVPPHWPMGCAV